MIMSTLRDAMTVFARPQPIDTVMRHLERAKMDLLNAELSREDQNRLVAYHEAEIKKLEKFIERELQNRQQERLVEPAK